jgi:hypothetical protein
VRILPPTCRVPFIAFDGGGSRGIICLAYIEELRKALGLQHPVQENVDYVIGTSSGERPAPTRDRELTHSRWGHEYRALCQVLESEEEPCLLSEVCEGHLPIKGRHRAVRLLYAAAYSRARITFAPWCGSY